MLPGGGGLLEDDDEKPPRWFLLSFIFYLLSMCFLSLFDVVVVVAKNVYSLSLNSLFCSRAKTTTGSRPPPRRVRKKSFSSSLSFSLSPLSLSLSLPLLVFLAQAVVTFISPKRKQNGMV
jgi:hypothetical protein